MQRRFSKSERERTRANKLTKQAEETGRRNRQKKRHNPREKLTQALQGHDSYSGFCSYRAERWLIKAAHAQRG
jgi:hypothetical protein